MPTCPAALDRAQRIVDAAPHALLIAGPRQVVFANPAAVSLLGAAHLSQVFGRSPLDFFAGDAHDAIRTRLESAGHATEPIDVTLVRLDARAVPVELRTGTLHDPDDDTLVLLALSDITHRREQDAELRASEERLRLAFAGAQEGVWDWNLETNAVIYSKRWKEMLGYKDDEISPDIRAWEKLLHPEDRAYAETLHERVQAGQQTYAGEFRLRHREGHYITVLSRGLPIRRADGRVTRIVGTHLDITARKRTELALRQSEERLTLAFAGAQEGIWDWDLETNAVVYSSHWKRMLGYLDEEIEPHISAWERLVHPDDRAEADRAHALAMRGGEMYQAEFRLRHRDGHYVHVLSRGFPVRHDHGGPIVRIVGTHFDLTERRAREAQRARNELLAHLVDVQEDERKRIARDMHDQFGEHLTALSLEIARLKAWSGNDDVRRHAEALQTIAERLDGDVEQLAWQLRPTALDDLGLRAALANYLEEWSQRHGVATELHTSGLFDHRLAPEVETALYRIGQEALNNVAKHARATRVEMILERRSDCVLLILEDDGIGFELTHEADDRRGFGLVGMRERATLVGATLEVESAPGNGTTILVRIALAPDRPAPTEVV